MLPMLIITLFLPIFQFSLFSQFLNCCLIVDVQTLWCSWVLEGPSKKVYFGGDTGYCSVTKDSEHPGGDVSTRANEKKGAETSSALSFKKIKCHDLACLH